MRQPRQVQALSPLQLGPCGLVESDSRVPVRPFDLDPVERAVARKNDLERAETRDGLSSRVGLRRQVSAVERSPFGIELIRDPYRQAFGERVAGGDRVPPRIIQPYLEPRPRRRRLSRLRRVLGQHDRVRPRDRVQGDPSFDRRVEGPALLIGDSQRPARRDLQGVGEVPDAEVLLVVIHPGLRPDQQPAG